jgi:hypothetical protein
MDAIRDWAFSVCAALAVSGVALQLLPKSNLSGVFKLVVSVFFLCSLISPVAIRMTRQRLELETYSAEAASTRAEALTAVAEAQALKQAKAGLIKNTADKLRQMGIKYLDITINISVNGQSEAAILLAEDMRGARETTQRELETALGMDVALDYA